jgi:hypothetical protein
MNWFVRIIFCVILTIVFIALTHYFEYITKIEVGQWLKGWIACVGYHAGEDLYNKIKE